jgi:hypothetical protein
VSKVTSAVIPCIWYQARNQRGASECIARSTNLDAPTRNFQNTKDADQPAKKTCDSLPHPHVAFVEPPWWERTRFQQGMECTYKRHIEALSHKHVAVVKQ